MRRGTKWLLAIVGAFVVVIAAAVVFLATFDWNRAKPWLTSNLTTTLGRTFQIDGDLHVGWHRDADLEGWRAWIPSPHVTAYQVQVGNSEWARTPRFGGADSVEFDLALLPLLDRRIDIQLMRFVNPDAALERADDGRENWTFTDKPSTWHCEIGRIAVNKANFTYYDHGQNIDVAGSIDALGESIAFDQQVTQQIHDARHEVLAQIGLKSTRHFEERAERRAGEAAQRRRRAPQDYAFRWTATGHFQKLPFRGNGKLGGVYYLRNPERPFPLLGDMRIGETHIVLVGTLTDPADLDALDWRLWLAGPNLSLLYDIAAVPLPNSPPYAMEGRLLAQFAGTTRVQYENFTARIGQSDMSGSLHYEARAPRPLLTGKVESEELQFRDLAPLIGADGAGPKTGADTKLLPEQPFRPERWRAVDANVEFTGNHVFRDSELPIHDVDARVVLDDAQLSLAPFKFHYASGDVDASLRLDGRAAPIKGNFDMKARGMQLKELLPGAATVKGVTLGRADGEAKLSATGQSVGALLGAANGELRLLLDSGTISKQLLETAGLNMPNIVLTRMFGDKQVKIDCAAADLVAKSGVFDARTFIIDTDVARITIDGSIDLGREWIDLVVHPDSKGVRLLSLHSPLHVRGPFKNIDVSIDKGALLARAAGAIGLATIAAPAAALVPLTSANVGADDNRCATLLKQSLQPDATQTAPRKSK